MSSMNNVVSLEDIFHKRVFRVPDYQRGYSWEKQQVQELLEDLELLGPDRFHYTGTVVLHESGSGHRMDKDGNSYAPVEIVDGQQRLTTIVLLLDGIRRALSQFSQSQDLPSGIKKNYIATKALDGQELPKISLNEDTDHFFKEVILSDQPSVEGAKITSEQRLCTAKEQIAIYLKGKADATPGKEEEWLQDLFRKLTHQLRFTLYRVGDDAEVGIIFEVMNGRGKPLTELEKVKNYLLHASSSLHDPDQPNELAESINGAWAEILRQLMAADLVSSADEDRLLRAHWLARYNPQARQWEGSKSVKEGFSLRRYKGRPKTLLRRLRSYTEGLRASCVSFCDAYQPNRDASFTSFKTNPGDRKQVIEWSSRLVRIGVVVTFLPLLLAVRKRWPDNPDKYLEILKLCEPFAFRVYKLRGYRSDAGQAALFRLGYELSREKCEFPEAVRAVKLELSHRCGNDDFGKLMSSEEPTDWYNRSGLRYFLYEYEITLASQQNASPIVDWKDLRDHDQNTIEHILPQSIDSQRDWQSRFKPKDHKLYVHDLGNLTLTKHNSHYLNKPFSEKKGAVDAKGHCYAKSPLYLERDLTRWEHWDASAINKRRSELLKWARNRWAVDLSDLEDDERELETAEDQLDEDDES